jgi:putative membrane protein
MNHSQTGAYASARATAGGDVEQQTIQQFRQFASDPETACDKMFVLKAACGNQFEVEFARQAQQKAQNQQVKQLAQQIIQDHQQAQQQLQQIAQQLNIQLPQSLPQVKQEELRVFSALPAEQFEKEFVCINQAEHAKGVIEYRAVAQGAKNEQVKSYAQQTLPKLTHHYEQTQQAAVALGLPSGGPEAVPASGRIQGQMDMGTRSGDMKTNTNTSGRTGTGMQNPGDTPPEHAGPTPDTRNPQR